MIVGDSFFEHIGTRTLLSAMSAEARTFLAAAAIADRSARGPFYFDIAVISSNSSFVSGTTERRESRTKAMSFNAGLALIAASVTELFRRLPASNSTAT